MIKCVVFDFDGTLVLSNKIKYDGFLAIANNVTNDTSIIVEILSMVKGDRFDVFKRFVNIVDKTLDAGKLADAYSSWCEKRIVGCQERQNANIVLKNLKSKGISRCLNSATPRDQLISIVNKIYDKDLFDDIYGGYNCKVINLEKIMKKYNLSNKEIVVVGDGIDDYKSAIDIDCHFIAIQDGELHKESLKNRELKKQNFYFIDNLNEVLHEINKINVK